MILLRDVEVVGASRLSSSAEDDNVILAASTPARRAEESRSGFVPDAQEGRCVPACVPAPHLRRGARIIGGGVVATRTSHGTSARHLARAASTGGSRSTIVGADDDRNARRLPLRLRPRRHASCLARSPDPSQALVPRSSPPPPTCTARMSDPPCSSPSQFYGPAAASSRRKTRLFPHFARYGCGQCTMGGEVAIHVNRANRISYGHQPFQFPFSTHSTEIMPRQ